ncbi:MAG: HAD family hydrolase, partial [Planctomycetota bacterium]
MGRAAIRAITFDLWDTVLIDDSDEPKRKAQGLEPKPVERRNLVRRFLERHEPIRAEQINVAYDTVDAAFRQVWYGQNVTWTVRQRLGVLLKSLGRNLPEPEMAELVRLHEDMELTVRPDLAVGVAEVLQNLYGKYRLGVISDAIFSPGRTLRRLLAHYNLMKFFDAFVFSDEIGFAKPD